MTRMVFRFGAGGDADRDSRKQRRDWGVARSSAGRATCVPDTLCDPRGTLPDFSYLRTWHPFASAQLRRAQTASRRDRRRYAAKILFLREMARLVPEVCPSVDVCQLRRTWYLLPMVLARRGIGFHFPPRHHTSATNVPGTY